MTDGEHSRISTGVEGFDTVLKGGFFPHRSYLVTGQPGTGKTILGLSYLTAGLDASDTCLFVNLEESAADIRANAATLGFDLDGIEFLDLSPQAEGFTDGSQYQVFTPGEVEGPDLSDVRAERISTVDPDRVFVDPLSELRNLATEDYQFRKLINGFSQSVTDRDATLLFTSQATAAAPDADLLFISDGTIELERDAGRRTLKVVKFRGSSSEGGDHSLRITGSGMEVYPVLTPDSHGCEFSSETIPAGVPEIDELLEGGIDRGTVTILSGPTGVGKTTLGVQFMEEAAGRGERSVVYLFEESRGTLLERSGAVNIPAAEMLDRGTLALEEFEPLDRSPAEFAAMVRRQVEQRVARIVMIDGIDGYRLSLQGGGNELERELSSLVRYLKNMGVASILVDTVDAVTGEFQPTRGGVSYLGDNIVFLRYLEIGGELRKAIGILKKRTSPFERTLREFEITRHGIKVGEPLSGLRGILSGTPEFVETDGPPPSIQDH